MRIADKMTFNNLNRNLSKNRSEMTRLQGEAASQKRVNRPSDDPVASHRILSARSELQGIEQYTKNISTARTFLEYSDQALSEVTDLLVRAKELAIGQASDGGSNEDSRRAVATEVEQLRWQALQVSNRKVGDRYIFAGHRTEQIPFSNGGEYEGDAGDIKIQIDKDSFLTMNVPGDKVFLGHGLGRDGVIKASFETPTNLEEVEEFKQAQGVEPPKTRGPRGNDDPQPTKGKDNEPGRGHGPQTQGLLRRLASDDVQTQHAPVEATSGSDVFQVLKNFEVSLMTGDKTGIQESINDIEGALDQVINARAQVGARVGALDRTFEAMQKAKLDNIATKSEMEDSDLFQVLSDINKTEGALQATLQTSGKLVQPSLLDFLR